MSTKAALTSTQAVSPVLIVDSMTRTSPHACFAAVVVLLRVRG
jgi:hypothetical protein